MGGAAVSVSSVYPVFLHNFPALPCPEGGEIPVAGYAGKFKEYREPSGYIPRKQ